MRLNLARSLIGVVILFNLQAAAVFLLWPARFTSWLRAGRRGWRCATARFGGAFRNVECALCGGVVASGPPAHLLVRIARDADNRPGGRSDHLHIAADHSHPAACFDPAIYQH